MKKAGKTPRLRDKRRREARLARRVPEVGLFCAMADAAKGLRIGVEETAKATRRALDDLGAALEAGDLERARQEHANADALFGNFGTLLDQWSQELERTADQYAEGVSE